MTLQEFSSKNNISRYLAMMNFSKWIRRTIIEVEVVDHPEEMEEEQKATPQALLGRPDSPVNAWSGKYPLRSR